MCFIVIGKAFCLFLWKLKYLWKQTYHPATDAFSVKQCIYPCIIRQMTAYLKKFTWSPYYINKVLEYHMIVARMKYAIAQSALTDGMKSMEWYAYAINSIATFPRLSSVIGKAITHNRQQLIQIDALSFSLNRFFWNAVIDVIRKCCRHQLFIWNLAYSHITFSALSIAVKMAKFATQVI